MPIPGESSAYRTTPDEWVWLDANGNYRGEADPPPNQEQTEDDDAGKPCACSPGGGKGVWVNTLQNRVVSFAPDQKPNYLTPKSYLDLQALIPELIQLPGIAPTTYGSNYLNSMLNLSSGDVLNREQFTGGKLGPGKGYDDVFSKVGDYIGSIARAEPSTEAKVFIATDSFTYDYISFNDRSLKNNTVGLTEITNYKFNTLISKKGLVIILKSYLSEVKKNNDNIKNIDPYIGVTTLPTEEFTFNMAVQRRYDDANSKSDLFIPINSEGKIPAHLAYSGNFASIVYHEAIHVLDNDNNADDGSDYTHATVYKRQFENESIRLTTRQYQYDSLSNFCKCISESKNSFSQKELNHRSEIDNLIDSMNKILEAKKIPFSIKLKLEPGKPYMYYVDIKD
jgi:hypothetical protein